MKRLSSKRARSLNINSRTREKVWARDGGRCVLCGSQNAFPEAHFVPRSKGGLGIEENVLTLCRRCHRAFDQGDGETRRTIRAFLRRYLSACYTDWDEQSLYYKKE